ncbi:VirK/YbjX family protein [Pectobacterium punjabense]|uniref:VirK/YbjX family protein n=1 Tax=Pectobacterium punjabense TaxID=2108399 RepID=UPI00311E359E
MTKVIENSLSNNLPKTPLDLFFSLSRGTFMPNKIWISNKFRIKFFLRSLIMPVLTYRLLNMVTQHPYYESVLLTQPRLPCRIHRPYLNSKLSRKKGVDAILHHYERIQTFLDDGDFSLHLSAAGLTIASLEGKDGEIYKLKLLSTYKLDREGEATVILNDQTDNMLSEISFTLCYRFNECSLIIGGLQGPNIQDAQQRIHKATKDFHGIFPKRIVLEALLLLSQLMNVQSVYAVTNEAHVYQSLRYNKRKKHMHADYDSLWEMSGGCRTADGYYKLPLIIQRKNIDDIASKKRSEYRRRYSLIDDINIQITKRLTHGQNTVA